MKNFYGAKGCITFFLLLFGLGLLLRFWYIFLALSLVIGYLMYREHQKKQAQQKEQDRLEALFQQSVRNYEKFLLFQEEEDVESMDLVGRLLLNQLDQLSTCLSEIEQHLGFDSYKSAYRLVKLRGQIAESLDSIPSEIAPEMGDKVARRLRKDAPEIYELYLRIHEKNVEIDALIQKISSHQMQELMAEHGIVVDQFSDIVTGYLKIKQEPEHYHGADERLERARQALELLDEQLTFSLRQLNEENLTEFEISLQMIQKGKGLNHE